MMNPPSSKIEFDNPEDGYFQAYLLIQESEATKNQQESISYLEKSLEYLRAVKSSYPDWKTPMVDGRIQNTKNKLDFLSMNELNSK